MTSANVVKQSIKYTLLATTMLLSLMYVPTYRLANRELMTVVVMTVGALVIMDHWCPSTRYCLRDMDACINYDTLNETNTNTTSKSPII